MEGLLRYSRVLAIVGDILQVQVAEAAEGERAVVRFNDLAVVEEENGRRSLAGHQYRA
jgi:V/A-type H+-transporting ATPase subunit B